MMNAIQLPKECCDLLLCSCIVVVHHWSYLATKGEFDTGPDHLTTFFGKMKII